MSPAPEASPVRAPSPARRESRRAPTLVSSFGFAWEGVVRTAQRERNMRIHLFAALCVGLAGVEVRFGTAARLALLLAVALVIAAEVLNSALEALVDLHTSGFHPKAKLAKDAAAGAVLVLAGGAVLIGVAVLAEAWPEVRRAVAQLGWRALAHATVLIAAARLLVPPRRRRRDVAATCAAVGALALLAPGAASVAFLGVAAGTLAVASTAALRSTLRA